LEKDHVQPNTTGILSLNCGDGSVVSKVLFADFGTPSGGCGGGTFEHNASCSASSSATAVESLCLHKQSCEVKASVKTFSDPCPAVPKRLAVNVTCEASPAPPPQPQPVPLPTPAPPPPLAGPRHFTWTISIPVGSTAAVHVPLLGAIGSGVTISVDSGDIGISAANDEAGGAGADADHHIVSAGADHTGAGTAAVVWDHGRFISGTAGVLAARASEGTDSVELECGSGLYAIQMREV
jgi:hypothetical protein